jgi:drug/metabolite transporter (DMT)-like permease
MNAPAETKSSLSLTQPIGWKSALLALTACLFRGANLVALKFALTAFAPFWTAFFRMMIGLTAIGTWAKFTRAPLMPRRENWAVLAKLSALMIVQVGFVHFGADLTSPAYASVLLNSNPLFTNLIAHFVVADDRLTWTRAAGLTLAFSGICGVFLGEPEQRLASSPAFGNAIIVAAAMAMAIRTVYTQRVLRTLPPIQAVFWQMVILAPCYFLGALVTPTGERDAISWTPVLAILYQGVAVNGITFLMWTTLLRKHAPGSLTTFSFTVPIFGVLLSALLFSEAVSVRLIYGMAAVTLGIALAHRAGLVRSFAALANRDT